MVANEDERTGLSKFLVRSLILLRSEIPSGKCTNLRNVAPCNNRDHPTRSLSYCLFAPHIYGCCSSRTSRLWWISHSTERQRRGCNSTNRPSFMFWRFEISVFHIHTTSAVLALITVSLSAGS